LEKALASGYQKFDKIPKDPDLKNLQAKPALAELIAKYKSRADANPPDIFQRFQLGSAEERAMILDEVADGPADQATTLAEWAMKEPDHQLRFMSMHLWQRLDVARSKPAILQGLYDSNGYVKKAAADALVSYGKDIEALAVWAIADKQFEASFYAMQILTLIDARDSADKMVPLLQDEDYKVRYLTAQCLARLRAVSAIPQIEAALKNLPKEESNQGIYRAILEGALDVLNDAQKAEEK
jgi:HEAT repeat protein